MADSATSVSDASPAEAEAPRTPERVHRAATAPNSARSIVRGEQLFAKAKALQERLRKKANELPKDCTFVPDVAKTAAATDSITAEAAAPSSRFELLYKKATAQQAKAAKKRAEAEASKPSFTPTLVAKAPKSTEKPRASLYDRAVAQQKRLDELAANAGVDEECSFKPKVTRKAASKAEGTQSRLYNAQVLKEKAAKREALRKEREQADCTFSPQLVAKQRSAPSPEEAAKRRKVYNKLFSDAKAHNEKIAAAQASKEAEEASVYTFRPAINHRARGASSGGKQDAGERLYKSGVDMLSRRALEAQQAGLEGCTFKPQITKRAKAKDTQVSGTVHERLFKQAAARAPRSDKAEPALAWEQLLRDEAPVGPAASKVVALSEAQAAAVDRLHREGLGHEARRRSSPDAVAQPFEGRVDWEIQLRTEESDELTAAVSKKPVDEEAAKKQDAVFKRLFSEGAAKNASAEASASGVVDLAAILRRDSDAPAVARAAVPAAAAEAADRLFRTQLKGHEAADKATSDADAQAAMLRTCWHATLRTEHPVALRTVVEAV